MFEPFCCCTHVYGCMGMLLAQGLIWQQGLWFGCQLECVVAVVDSIFNKSWAHLTKVRMHSQHTHKPEALRPLLKCLCRADHLLRRAPLKMLPRCRVSGAPRFNGARENVSPAYCTKANSVQIRLNSDVASALTIRLNAVICYHIL